MAKTNNDITYVINENEGVITCVLENCKKNPIKQIKK